MTEYKDSVLICEAGLDLKYLKPTLENENISMEFCETTGGAISKCKSKKYSVIVLNSTGPEGLDEEIIAAISWSANIFTPVIVITQSNNSKTVNSILMHKFEMIRFPFDPDEFYFRVTRMIRLKQNEQAVHNNLMRFRTLFGTFPVGIAQTDQHGNFIAVNPFFAECLNMAETDVYKENFFQLCHPEDYFIERKQLDRLLRKEARKVNFEIRFINNDGKTSVCKIVSSAVWENDETFSFFTFVIDRID